MRDRTVFAICLTGLLLLFPGFLLSGCMLFGCGKNDLDEEKGSVERVQQEQVEAPTPAANSEKTKVDLPPAQKQTFLGAFGGTVLETMNASRYTYLLVDTGTEQVWAAVPESAIEVGDIVAIPRGIPMTQFRSETLDRTFELVYFSKGITVKGDDREEEGAAAQSPSEIPNQLPQGHPDISGTSTTPAETDAPDIDFTGLKKPDGGTTIVDVFTDKDSLAGQEVLIRGKVVKSNRKILGKNWLHLRDGTGAAGTNDLTITTKAEVNVGDTVLVRGKIVLNKDFGFGYKFDVLIEDAEVTRE